jgi:hypothetical protein
MHHTHKINMAVEGDLVLKKDQTVLLNSGQLYELIRILTGAKLLLPEEWKLDTEQDADRGYFRIILGAPDMRHIPLEAVPHDDTGTDFMHRAGEFFYRNLSPDIKSAEDLVKRIQQQILDFGISEQDFSVHFNPALGRIIISFEAAD